MDEKRVFRMKRSEIRPYLVKLGFNLDFLEQYDKSPIVLDPTTNLVKVSYGPMNVKGIRTNDVEYSMIKHKHWNCDWIIIEPDPTPVYEIRREEE